jgi:hypothetical protein
LITQTSTSVTDNPVSWVADMVNPVGANAYTSASENSTVY